MSDPLQTAEMPKLDTFDEEFGQDPAAVVRRRRSKVVRRLVMLAVVALCAGTIAALAFAWSSADGQLRLELQSITPSPRTVAREGAEQEIGRLRRRMDDAAALVTRELASCSEQEIRRPPEAHDAGERHLGGLAVSNRSLPTSNRFPPSQPGY
jgi:hypothetical protein